MSLFTASLAEQLQPLLRQPFESDTFIQDMLQPVFQGRGATLTVLAPAAREELALTELPEAAQQLASSVTRYGHVQTADARRLDLYDIRLKPHVQPERNRAGLSAMVRRLLAGSNAALATFAPATPGPWRLSLVARDTILHDGQFVSDDTPPKRFTFLLGPGSGGRTPAARLAALANEPSLTLAKVREAFSVDTLTREFYRDLSNWYFWALPQIRFNTSLAGPEQAAHAAACTIKIITRVIFIWFLKEKRLVAPQLFQLPALRKLLRSMQGGDSTFYAGILQHLFFSVLNKQIPDRFHFSAADETQLAQLFQDFDLAKEYFNSSPFVNGGLFDGTVEECAHPNPALDKLHIPNSLFFGDSTADLSGTLHNPKAKKVAVHGLIDLLHRYQFTAEENTPIDQEVALDPELLGKIFENLLASYNEETQTTARKASGSFYTPREIVDYMVDESLLTYLQGQLPTTPDLPGLLRPVLAYHTDHAPAELSGSQTEALIEALDRLTILDPAVGSGAFPMGILQKMTRLLQVLDPHNQRWLKLVLHRLPTHLRLEMSQRLQGENLDYVRKLGIIQQSIYGVDIQPVALQIAKLRFFISLIVEQRTTTDATTNYGVLPLPNLEFKFVCANTLIGLQKEANGLFDYQHLQADLAELRDQFFKSSGDKKREVEKAFKAKQNDLAGRLLDERSRAFQLATWEPFKEKSSPWFDAEWMFGVKEGFDLVIGNPPYVQLQKMKEASRVLARQGYKTYAATSDLYVLFYERGMDLLRPDGLLCFITSNKWMRAGYGGVLRSYFTQKANPLQLIDFAGTPVFEGVTVDTNILLVQKADNKQDVAACVISSDFDTLHNLSLYFQQRALPTSFQLDGQAWVVLSPLETQIRHKMETIGTPLKDWEVDIYRGILTGYNEAFIIDEETKNSLIKKSPKSAEIIRPILRGRDIGAYNLEYPKLWILFIPWHFPVELNSSKDELNKAESRFSEEYPEIYQHLLSHRISLSARNPAETGIRYEWYALQRFGANYSHLFSDEKIVWGNLNEKAKFSIDKAGACILAPCNMLTSKKENLTYLLSFLNSKVTTFFMSQQGYSREGGYVEYKKQFLEHLPVPRLNNDSQLKIVNLATKIIYNKENDLLTQTMEDEVDELIFNELKFTREEINYLKGWTVEK